VAGYALQEFENILEIITRLYVISLHNFVFTVHFTVLCRMPVKHIKVKRHQLLDCIDEFASNVSVKLALCHDSADSCLKCCTRVLQTFSCSFHRTTGVCSY
jgi:hypothetical protein